MPKSNARRGKVFRERKKKEKLAASPVENVTKNQKYNANSSSATAKSRSEYMREYQARKKNITKYSLNAEYNDKQKNSANSSSATAKSPSEYTGENIKHGKKTLQNTLLMPSLRVGNAFETFLMTAQINTDFVNHPVSSTTKPSTSRVHVETDTCESIINSILRYKDYDFTKASWPQ
ncbi:uncharacterized protein TNCV_4360321 [Trichonephila clavipes]|uniref:Uncharacterized protein n=1 Tax=Trichonephila clavipes TaxID=2585209 RepID=A0A8X7BH56_TRICX|nr:uncharacterized protein TNCV_4360321 [Trichonephila clavipes]